MHTWHAWRWPGMRGGRAPPQRCSGRQSAWPASGSRTLCCCTRLRTTSQGCACTMQMGDALRCPTNRVCSGLNRNLSWSIQAIQHGNAV